jgi:hypothetical protein
VGPSGRADRPGFSSDNVGHSGESKHPQHAVDGQDDGHRTEHDQRTGHDQHDVADDQRTHAATIAGRRAGVMSKRSPRPRQQHDHCDDGQFSSGSTYSMIRAMASMTRNGQSSPHGTRPPVVISSAPAGVR